MIRRSKLHDLVLGPGAALVLGVAFVLSAATGCGDPPAPANRPQPVQPPPQTAAAAEEAPAEEAAAGEEEESEFVYTPVGKRDPFQSPFKEALDIENLEPGEQRRLTPLQKWDLEQLKVQAIISGTSDPMAMVVDPDGVGHVVRRGTLIGKNWGKVTAIRRDCIVITEQLRDATGAVSAVRQERCLPKTDRERAFEKQFD